jgi:PhzF family phenazine biosynthesis protein
MELSLFQVDAFAQRPFTGNPAAVVPLSEWLPDARMQQIAMENNLSETAFFVPAGDDYHIRWFTPVSEINLCGHATLASAYVIFSGLAGDAASPGGSSFSRHRVKFESQSGPLSVTTSNGRLVLDFPAWPPTRMERYPEILDQALAGVEVLGVYENRDLLVELESEHAVRAVHPDFGLIRKLGRNVMVTAPGAVISRLPSSDPVAEPADFVSRFFAPHLGVDEDPVTGSAHTQLIPFWGEKLGKKQMFARQLSERGGDLWCTWDGDRVGIGGHCSFFLKGTISIP